MKSKTIKIAITILIVLVIAVGFVFLHIYYKGLSPTETVELYFTYFSNKEPEKRDELLIERLRDTFFPWDYLEYVTLLSCYEDTHCDETLLEKVQKNWNPDAQYATKVYVNFVIKFKDDAPTRGGFNNDIYDWTFHLAKQSANEPWVIVSFGT